MTAFEQFHNSESPSVRDGETASNLSLVFTYSDEVDMAAGEPSKIEINGKNQEKLNLCKTCLNM